MKNIRIELTVAGTYVVKADTQRFGKDAIMFEGTERECQRYIVRTTPEAAKEIIKKAIVTLPEAKREKLDKQEAMNMNYTSQREMEHKKISYTSNGYYIELEGCRCGYKFYVDHNFNHMRKPVSEKVLAVESI